MDLKKRLNLGSLMRKRSSQDVNVDENADTPEANAARGVRLFCESGAANSGEEVLHLPTIVDNAVATPAAAAAAAQQMRKFLSKENYDRPHVQYNAVMLIRILADNPGPSFTKNLDKRFADTIKQLLRNGRDPSVAQIVRESLSAMQREKVYDTNLNTLFAMWEKEKTLIANAQKQFGPRTLNAPAWNGQQAQGGFSSGQGQGRSSSRALPPPHELAGRIEEARTSAKLLLQLVQSTPPNELLSNDLVKEFAERCTSAQRSLQTYIACDNPPPDDDTMLTLIETNEQLSLAASKHQRAVLQARRLVGPSQSQTQLANSIPAGVPQNSYEPPPSLPARESLPPIPAPQPIHSTDPPQPLTSHAIGYKNDELPLPPSLQAAPNRSRISTNDDNPFADPRAASAPTPDPRANGQPASPDSDYSGYQPSYVGHTSANHSTAQGFQSQPRGEEDLYAPDNTPMGRRTPDRTGPQYAKSHDVSPIAERNTVTYRY